MKRPSPYILVLFYLLQAAGFAQAAKGEAVGIAREGDLAAPTDPGALANEISQRLEQTDSIFEASPIGGLRDLTGEAKATLYSSTGINVDAVFTHVFQGATDTVENENNAGTATTLDLLATWDLFDKGEPTQAQLVIHGQYRWDYGTTGPEDIGFVSLASIIGTADTFSEYRRALWRNIYWRQGSPETGWVYRIGKITPDALLASSKYLDSQTTFLPGGGTGPFAIALPDSGYGTIGAWYPNDKLALVALVSDANGDRFDNGDIGEGDMFYAAEMHLKIAPRTAAAPYSKVTIWHNDGTKDGAPSNGMLGPSGWGYFLVHQQELTNDGRAIGVLRYGKSFDDSALYEQQGGVHFLYDEPRMIGSIEHDMVGLALNWAETSIAGSRDEYNFETFYRLPIFPDMDATFSYQYVIDPALTRDIDNSHLFSLRLRAIF